LRKRQKKVPETPGVKEVLGTSENITLTAGNIRNRYIRVRQFNGLIPTDIVDCSGEIVLDLDGVGEIKTHINKEKGILAERKGLRRFFEVNDLKEGDQVAIQKIDGKRFRMTTSAVGEEKPSDELYEDDREDLEEYVDEKQLALFGEKVSRKQEPKGALGRKQSRANNLNGKEWTVYSISIWKDIRKASHEKNLEHPAMFPVMLVQRIIRCFTTTYDSVILDPFMGSGSTLVGACLLDRKGIGFEIYPDYIELAKQRLAFSTGRRDGSPAYKIYCEDSRKIGALLGPESVDFCVTSPPYWNILSQRRTADNKVARDYGDSNIDLGRIEDYSDFVCALGKVFCEVHRVLKPGKYCVINVMDLRKGSRFYPFHSDLARELEKIGFVFDDMIIWDRSHEYNNLRPLGYPAVFRINKVHEYLLIFQKPKTKDS